MTNPKKALFQRFDSVDVRHKNILLVEDNEGDVELLKASFELSGYPHSLFVVGNGEDAIIFLNSYTPLPDLVIMDLNMPTISGHEALQLIRSNPKTANIPIVMMTGSDTDNDKIEAQKISAKNWRKRLYCKAPIRQCKN